MTVKNILTFGALSAAILLAASSTFTSAGYTKLGSQASAKATCAVSEVYLMDSTTSQGWTTVLSTTIKTANKSDIFCDVSLESGLITQTQVASKGGKKDTSTASAEIRVRCLLDGELAYPGEIVFSSRTQEMSATFQGLIAECFTVGEDGTIILDESCVEPEELELILSTMSANSFNFIYVDCTSGTHTLEVQAMVTTSAYSEEGTANAYGTIGKGSCTVEQVRMTNDVIEL